MGKLMVSSSPHVHTSATTQRIMLDVIIALVPAMVASVILFGWRAALLLIISVLTCVLCEYLSRKVMKRENTMFDLSAVVTGILLAMNVPSSLNPLMLMLGDVVAIVVVKQMFGGIGQNFVNPALMARIILMNSFPGPMATWPKPMAADAATTATPLGILNEGGSLTPDYLQLFLGYRGGCLGETCALALLLGFAYLLYRKVITPVIPLVYIGTAAFLSLLMGRDVLMDILAGGLLLGAIFMATDYTTSPITLKGQIFYAIGCGCLTMLIRQFGSLPEGVSYSIIIMNILTPLIERATRPHAFGKAPEKAKEAAKQ
ncbi:MULTISPECIES: RnfABCDGE type electron transport complex subunit D [Caproicibacterium]|uniref:Ion-translocating oxidoreductase complex subunit D n=1 Tax=Caproicibacterium argilliputei TaxID=3030016 RepID=A0AA97H0E9_9FIRM|nr:RnfABCDGE type electron transport complex subunit D [Caproicibacterium argilliputei]WOC31456.1 RnfABCDGE type electron transport complex subunit D [Caproicibacterium argilliputei]